MIQLVVFDWAGTTVDFGCFAPVGAFVEVFAARGVAVTIAEARGPMGLHKRDHIREMLEMPRVRDEWRRVYARDWTDDDVAELYDALLPVQTDAAARHADLVPGLLDCVGALRERGLRIGTSTGYARAVAEPVIAKAKEQGYAPDHNVCADDVPSGRPAPWMIYHSMQALDVYPPHAVVKVGDTVPDIQEGRNAGTWSIGVTDSSNEFGCTLAEYAALSDVERSSRSARVANLLHDAGAHAVIASLAELPALVDDLAMRVGQGERP